ncbi:auxin efflux carrier family protein [Actinidia rufa]|uniref:Auxin efflux carrier family protein n=1 Tax=Actinidia rufa TaxID=165716 RepID=A0A7J0DZL9_9ERIC|nr:auxin efflux carrier family protein [Actinidia rufa]
MFDNVVVAMVPLYVALILGYGSVKWLHIFTREQCDAINQFVCYFTLPLFTFEFTAHIDPFEMNYLFINADAISKVIIVLVLAFWAKCSILSDPSIVWLTLLLFVLEFRRSSSIDLISTVDAPPAGKDSDLEGNMNNTIANNIAMSSHTTTSTRPAFWYLMKIAWLKLAMNPNSYACIVGLTWAFLSNRWHFQMPSIMEGSILIMSRAGTGTAMFSMGLFMALQEKVISCGVTLTVFGMVLRFIAGPAAMAIGAIVVGLRGDVLRVAIIQAALPQSITSFIFVKEYGLHAEELSTAVIFGKMVSLPVLIAYYAILEFLH